MRATKQRLPVQSTFDLGKLPVEKKIGCPKLMAVNRFQVKYKRLPPQKIE